MSEPNTVDRKTLAREKRRIRVETASIWHTNYRTKGLKVPLARFQQPAAVVGEARDGISHYVLGDSCASLPVRHNLKETFRPLDVL